MNNKENVIEKFDCDTCQDTGYISQGYYEEEHGEFIITKTNSCRNCNED